MFLFVSARQYILYIGERITLSITSYTVHITHAIWTQISVITTEPAPISIHSAKPNTFIPSKDCSLGEANFSEEFHCICDLWSSMYETELWYCSFFLRMHSNLISGGNHWGQALIILLWQKIELLMPCSLPNIRMPKPAAKINFLSPVFPSFLAHKSQLLRAHKSPPFRKYLMTEHRRRRQAEANGRADPPHYSSSSIN